MNRNQQKECIVKWLKENDMYLFATGASFLSSSDRCSRDLGFKVSPKRMKDIALELIDSGHEYSGFVAGRGDIIKALTGDQWNALRALIRGVKVVMKDVTIDEIVIAYELGKRGYNYPLGCIRALSHLYK